MKNILLLNSEVLHRRLAAFNQKRLKPGLPGLTDYSWIQDLEEDQEFRFLEFNIVEKARELVAERASQAPKTPGAFIEWFEDLKTNGPGQGDSLFPWLAHKASLEEMRWFLTQEMAGEAGFDDLVAMTQVKLPFQSKMELAKNYWDEMGRGHPEALHSLLLREVSETLDLHSTLETTVWESLALANLMTALAINRRYTYLSIGALGAVEMTAPGRVALVNEGLKRLEVPTKARRYFALHATLDVEHSKGWNQEAIYPLIEEEPRAAQWIAEGALLRLSFGARCFERYRQELAWNDCGDNRIPAAG